VRGERSQRTVVRSSSSSSTTRRSRSSAWPNQTSWGSTP